MTQALTVQNLTAHYGTTKVLEDLSLSVGKGELVSLLGASGCGKTTTLRLIAGFLEPTSGSIKVVRVNDGPVVGVHMIGARVGELIGEAQLAVNWEAFPEDIAPLIHAHPTQNEALGEAFLAIAGKPLHAI